MATLTIRNLDDDIRDFLRAQAAENGRSMEAEVRDILKSIAKQGNTSPADVFARIHKLFSAIGGADDLVLPKREPVPAPPNFSE